MKTLFVELLMFLLFICSELYSQSELEIAISNETGQTIKVQCYPVSMVMNGDNEYNLLAYRYLDCGTGEQRRVFDYINTLLIEGTNSLPTTVFTFPYINPNDENYDPRTTPGFNFDGEDPNPGNAPCISSGSFGRGIYKIVLWYNEYEDSILVEIDGGQDYDIWLTYRPSGLYFKQIIPYPVNHYGP